MPKSVKSLTKSKKPFRFVALYTFLGLTALAISVFLIQKTTYFAPSASETNNLPQQKLEADAYIKYLSQYGLPKNDIDNYKLGSTSIKVSTRGYTNDQAYLPKLHLYVNGITKPYYDVKTVPTSNNFSVLGWTIPYLIKEGDEVSLEYFNDTELNRSKDVYINYIEINNRRFSLTSTDNRVWYDRSNKDDGTKYGDQNDFGNSFDNKEVLRYGDYLNFKSAGFNGDMYWNGSIHVQYRKDQTAYPQYKAEYLSDKNKNRFFDDPGVITRNEKGSCKLNNGIVTCSELDFDWKFSSPDDRYDRIPGDFFLAKFTKTKFFYPGKYKFSFLVDDGIRFYLDNKLLIDKYNVESGPRLSEVTVDLTKGNHNLKIEYLENTEQASLKFDITPINIDQSQLSEDEKLELLYEPYELYNELEDSDGDGLLNIFEMSQMQLKTKPDLFDTDGNGISDAYEDTDKDGLLNILEQKYHTNPLEVDNDLDGIDDIDEIYKYKTDPLKYDTDGDGLNDGFEVTHNLNPSSKDTNSNGKTDAYEIMPFVKQDDITKTKVDITAEAILSEELKFEEQNPAYTAGGAEKTMLKIVDIVNPNNRQIQNVKVSLGYDDEIISKTKSKTPDKLKIVYLNDKANNITPLDDQNIDKTQKVVTGTINHLSMFVLIDQDTWDDIFASDFVPNIRGSNGKLNIVFAIDDSTSMTDNDPRGNRIIAPVELIDGLKSDDKTGVIIFNFTPTVIQTLTSNKTEVKSKLIPSNLHYDGETNLSAAIRRSVEVLRGDSNNETSRIIIALTDGILDDKKQLENGVSLAIEHNVRIYTIGLGNGVDDNILKDISRDTGGKYYKIRNSAQIIEAYADIRNQGKDSDGDGLSDTLEISGIRTCTTGVLIKPDPNNNDTDGDQLSDGIEIGIYNPNGQLGGCYEILSNPLLDDTDHDGDLDNIEVKNRTQSTRYDETILYGYDSQYNLNYLVADLSRPDKVCFRPQIGLKHELGARNNDGSLRKEFNSLSFEQLITDQNAKMNGISPKAAINTDYVSEENDQPLAINYVKGLDYSGPRTGWSSLSISKNNAIKLVKTNESGLYNVSGGGPQIMASKKYLDPCIPDNRLGYACNQGKFAFFPISLVGARTIIAVTDKNFLVSTVSRGIRSEYLSDVLRIVPQKVASEKPGFDIGIITEANMFDGGGSPSMAYDFNNNGKFDSGFIKSDIATKGGNSLSAALLMFEGDACEFR